MNNWTYAAHSAAGDVTITYYDVIIKILQWVMCVACYLTLLIAYNVKQHQRILMKKEKNGKVMTFNVQVSHYGAVGVIVGAVGALL